MSHLRSSELLASHFFSIQELLEIMTYPWFFYFKVFFNALGGLIGSAEHSKAHLSRIMHNGVESAKQKNETFYYNTYSME